MIKNCENGQNCTAIRNFVDSYAQGSGMVFKGCEISEEDGSIVTLGGPRKLIVAINGRDHTITTEKFRGCPEGRREQAPQTIFERIMPTRKPITAKGTA